VTAASNSITYSGLIPPMITPLTGDGEVDRGAIGRLVNFLVRHGVSGLFVLGSSGEGPWLTPAQRSEVIGAAVEAAGGRVPVLAGVLDPGQRTVIENVRHAADAGANAVVVTTPYYFGADQATQMRFFTAVADAAPVPVMLYNIPEMTHNPLTPATVRELAALPQFVGLKDSAGDWEQFTEFLTIRERYPAFHVFQGAERQAGRALLAGADGIVPGLGNLVPAVFVEMIGSVRAGDTRAVTSLAARIEAMWHLHTEGIWLSCLKYACSLLGFGDGTTAGHDGRLSAAAKARIVSLVSQEIDLDAGVTA
jgi:4-hydroxy-tetrahydrodipicolinate synthase